MIKTKIMCYIRFSSNRVKWQTTWSSRNIWTTTELQLWAI